MSTAALTPLAPRDLVPHLDRGDTFLLDVREPDEFADWVIPGATNIPLGQLEARLDEVDQTRPIVVICAKGARAQQGVEILARHGIAARVLEGGMGGWAETFDTFEGDFAGAHVIQVRRRGKGCLSYLVGGDGRCVVIDPALNIELYQELARTHGWQIVAVVDTHLHADHISGARALCEATGATLRLSPHDPFSYPFDALEDGDEIVLGDGVSLSVSAVAVPGHTEGSTLYHVGHAAAFTGDTLFLESVGRPDLADHAEEFAHNLYRSLHERVVPLGDEVMIFPAHYGTGVEVRGDGFVARPLGELRRELPALALDESSFVAWAVANVKDRPPNYQRIVRVNAGDEPVTAEATELELGPNRCAIA